MKAAGNLKLIRAKTNFNSDVCFKDIDINPLIRDFMIREAFYMFDEDHSGDIDKKEFTKLVTTLGWEFNEKRINDLMKEMDSDGSGTIDFEEFSDMMSKFQFGKESHIQQHLENAFNDFDKDMDTLVNAEDFRKVSEELDTIGLTKEDANMFVTFCKFFGKEKGIPSWSETGISKEEYINALTCIGFLFENKGWNDKSKISAAHTGKNSNNQSQVADSVLHSDKQTQSFIQGKQNKSNMNESNLGVSIN